jgi:cell wall-associated NlpC family hydrolase
VRRLAVLTLLALALAAPAAGACSSESWAKSPIATVTREGLLPGKPSSFRPADPLTSGTLGDLLAALGAPVPAPADLTASVTIAGLDASLVDALGLRPVADQLAAAARAAGLDPPARFGTEVVARLLGLRTDLPIADDSQELQPGQPATRADAAFSAARVLSLGHEAPGGVAAPGLTPVQAADAGGGVAYVRSIAPTFVVPALSAQQQEVLRTAVSLVGYPYVRGGDDENAEPGFDCSGLLWRVFKLASYPDAPNLAATIQGRTSAQMAGETPRSERIKLADLQPGDVMFFGPRGRRSKTRQIDHASIFIGNGWLIESSGQGVSLGRLDWYTSRFAWASRPLDEAAPAPTPAGRLSLSDAVRQGRDH